MKTNNLETVIAAIASLADVVAMDQLIGDERLTARASLEAHARTLTGCRLSTAREAVAAVCRRKRHPECVEPGSRGQWLAAHPGETPPWAALRADRTLLIRQAEAIYAATLGVPAGPGLRRFIQRLAATGTLPSYKAGGTRLIYEREFFEYLAARQEPEPRP